MKGQQVIDNVVADCVLKGGSVFMVESDHANGFPHVAMATLYRNNSIELYTLVDFTGRHPYEEVIKGILTLRRTEKSIRRNVPGCRIDSYIMLTNSPVGHWTELFREPLFVAMYEHYFPYKEVKRNSDPAAATPRI